MLLSKSPFHAALLVTLLTLTCAGMVSSEVPECITAEVLEPAVDLRGWAGQAEKVRTFFLEVPAAGIVSLDVMTDDGEAIPARVGFSPECGGRSEATILERSPSRLVFAARTPGQWWFRVAPRDPQGQLGFYRIVTAFTVAHLREETFEAVSGSGAFLRRTDFYAAAVTTGKSEQEIVDPDPDANPLVLERDGGRLLASLLEEGLGGLGTKSEQEIVDPDPDAARTGTMTSWVLFYDPAYGITVAAR